MRIEYTNVKLPPNTIVGATVTSLSTKFGCTLTRIIEDGRDDLIIERHGKDTVHLPWSQVKGGAVWTEGTPRVPVARSVDFARVPVQEHIEHIEHIDGTEDFPDIEDFVEPQDDTVRLMAPKRGRRKST